MTDDLVYRLRTCAAAITATDPRESWVALVSDDAAKLLVEASNALEQRSEPLGEPMAVISDPPATGPTWTTMDLPTVAPRPCPSCGSIDARIAHIVNRHVRLTCPRCTHQWEVGA
jgi:hypothetical protein